MNNPPTPRIAMLLGACALCVASSQAAVVFSEDFGSSQTNPTTNPFTTQNLWNYSDSAGTTINNNDSRLFNPNGAGSQETTVGWITANLNGKTFQQIESGGTFSALPTLNVGEAYLLTLSWYGSAQTSTSADAEAYVGFSTIGKNLTFVSGSNGTTAGYTPQTLTDSAPAPESILMNFIAEGGSGGYVDGRTFTASFLTTDDLNGSAFSIALGRGADLTANPVFVLYDNISLDVSVVPVPEPSAALLGGIGTLALLRRRRS